MGRSKTFDPSDILQRSLDVFWQHGYRNTSIEEIVAATDLTRASLYNTFGDKRGLYLRSLDVYKESVLAELLFPLTQPHSNSLDAVEAFFEKAIVGRSPKQLRRGCFLINTLHEVTKADEPEIFASARDGLQTVEACFLDCFARNESNRLSTTAARAVVQLLLCNLYGLRVASKHDANPVEHSRLLVECITEGARALTKHLCGKGDALNLDFT